MLIIFSKPYLSVLISVFDSTEINFARSQASLKTWQRSANMVLPEFLRKNVLKYFARLPQFATKEQVNVL